MYQVLRIVVVGSLLWWGLPQTASAQTTGADCGSTDPDRPCTGTNVSTEAHGVTFSWQFNCSGGACQLGRFVDGTPWVRHPRGGNVTITSVKPDSARTGLEKNPGTGSKVPRAGGDDTLQQGLWSGTQGGTQYVASLDLSTQLPFNAPPDDAVYVKTDEFLGSCGYTGSAEPDCINAYSTLTVLKNLPPDDKNGGETFRPSMSGDAKRVFTLADFDLSKLVSYAAAGMDPLVMPTYERVAARYLNGPVVNLFTTANGDIAREWVPKASGLPNYSAFAAQQMNLAIYRTLDGGALTAAKKRAVYGIIQVGIDVFGAYAEGVRFTGGAGQHHGYWAPMVYMGALTSDSAVSEKIRAATKPMAWNSNGGNLQFVELYQVRQNRNGEPIWGSHFGQDGCGSGGFSGYGRYWSDYAAYALGGKWQKKTCGDPYGYIDGPAERPGAQYFSVSSGIYVSLALLQKIWPEFDHAANNPVLKRFGERLMSGGYWTKPDQCAAIDPREAKTCNPYTSADSCTYFGKTWGVDLAGGKRDDCVTTAVAASRGHPKPVSRFENMHQQGTPGCGASNGIASEKPGCQLWTALAGSSSPARVAPMPDVRVPMPPVMSTTVR